MPDPSDYSRIMTEAALPARFVIDQARRRGFFGWRCAAWPPRGAQGPVAVPIGWRATRIERPH